MGLNKQKGNMYDFVTHTWNIIKGACEHDCTYCYMKAWGELPPLRFDKKELNTNLGENNFIFVGSSTDMWAEHILDEWIYDILSHCRKFNNTYLFQSKNPERFIGYPLPSKSILGTTIESNRDYDISKAPNIQKRVNAMAELSSKVKTMITIEPILDFDLKEMVDLIGFINPDWINIGADSKGHKMPEPDSDKIHALINALSKFTEVKEKPNLKRLMK